MDISRLLDSSLSVECLHCGHVEPDDFEVIDVNTVHQMQCATCGGNFHLAVMECSSCGVEWQFEWASEPTAALLDNLSCPACGESYVEAEAFPNVPGITF